MSRCLALRPTCHVLYRCTYSPTQTTTTVPHRLPRQFPICDVPLCISLGIQYTGRPRPHASARGIKRPFRNHLTQASEHARPSARPHPSNAAAPPRCLNSLICPALLCSARLCFCSCALARPTSTACLISRDADMRCCGGVVDLLASWESWGNIDSSDVLFSVARYALLRERKGVRCVG
ncbi:hypothetical protein BKA80DRAFT_26607 [Phyllosticta citrichinensis]